MLNELGDEGMNELLVFTSQVKSHLEYGEAPANIDEKSNRSLLERSIHNLEASRFRRRVRKKKNPFNKFLEKADIVEIAIRAPKISDTEELKVITILYDQLAIPTNETVKLYNLLIFYEQIQTFEMLLRYRMKELTKNKNLSKVTKVVKSDVSLGRKDDDNVYDFDEIISDAFSYSISINKLYLSFYLFKTYEDDVYGNKMDCIRSILNSFKNDDTQSNQVMYLEERLFILEKFMKFIEYNLALEFLTVIHDEITDDPNINFLVYCPNPMKIIVMLLNIVINVSAKHQNLKFKAQMVRSTLCDIAN